MKVTVSFNGTKIVVPCGDGDISVKELTQLASTRYKKAIGKSNDRHWISVLSLRTFGSGGMLDPDDRICDVCDDREQLEAIFDEKLSPLTGGHLHLGDGMSSEEDRMSGLSAEDLGLQVRRGSEPVLSQPGLDRNLAATPTNPNMIMMSSNRHQPHVVHPFSTHSSNSTLIAKEDYEAVRFGANPNQGQDQLDSLSDSHSFDAKCSLNVLRRREPLGASANKPDKKFTVEELGQQQQVQRLQLVRPTLEIIIPNEIGPLGIHVVPCNEDGRLIVQGIEPGGRVDRDGRLAVGDEIVDINGCPLTRVTFTEAQEIFKEAVLAKELKLQIIKGVSASDSTLNFENNKENVEVRGNVDGNSQQVKAEVVRNKVSTAVQANNTRKIGTVLTIVLNKGMSGLGFSVTARDNPSGGNSPIYIKNIMPKGAAIEEGSLKLGDRLLEVNDKPVDGMTRSEVVELLRNVPTNSQLTIRVSRHVSTGSDDQSGTLKNAKGDQDIPKSNSTDQNSSGVQNFDELDSNKQRSLSSPSDQYESYDENFSFPWKQREILTFDIPVHDTERAGLGVSVKGKTSSNREGKVIDLGIFVKSVINGGAASKDGRLKTNDQLVNINGMSLLQKPNPQAMETLRKAMHEEGPVPGIISLTVARQSFDLQGPAVNVQGGIGQEHKRTDSLSSQITSSSDDVVREYAVSQPNPRHFKSPKESISSLKNTRNPVLDRLMGKESAGIIPSNIRNDSYYMATHETWNNASIMQKTATLKQEFQAPTVHQNHQESVMIEQDQTTDSSNTRESMTSLLDANLPGFSRDQRSRQSMSEKHHATLDAKATDTYQKRKKARDDRLKQQQVEKALRWKKSASMESLHLIGKNHTNEYLNAEEREALRTQYVRASSVRVSRARGCNESFRQAVDRSYENNMPGTGGAIEGEDYEIEDFDEPTERSRGDKKQSSKNKIFRNFGAMFRLGSGSSGHGRSKSANRKSVPNINVNQQPQQQSSSSSKLPQSQSVPNYSQFAKSRSGGEIASTNKVPESQYNPHPQEQQKQQRQAQYQQQQQNPYDYLPSAMMRPGSRVAIADPGMNSVASDYEIIQRHLHKNRTSANQFQQQQQQPPSHVHHRSQSNPRMRPKSNFYEYDMWQYQPREQVHPQQQFYQPQQQQYGYRQPPEVPQKPSRPLVQEHFQAHNPEFGGHENPYASYYYGLRQPTHYGRTVGSETNPRGASHFTFPRGQNINLP